MRNKRLLASNKQFLVLLGITILVNVFIYTCCMPSQTRPPQYAVQKTFITSDCEDGRRLGNLMFNYASLVGISHMLNITAVMNSNFQLFDIFKITAEKSLDMENTLGSNSYKDYHEYGRRACAYDVGVRHLKKENIKLHGYFQSFKYFQNAYDIVSKEFQFQDHIIAEARIVYTNLLKSQHKVRSKVTVIGIHVRRGDTLDKHFSDYGYTTPGVEYYTQAMQYFTKKYPNVIFIVCTDDKEWTKEHISGDDIVHSDVTHDYVDLAILSMCDHVIISAGSFGWWGAWLANGTTVYYSKWPRPVSKLEYMVTKFDYFPKHWIPLP